MASSFMEFINARRHTASVIQHGAVSHVQPNQYAGTPSTLAPAPLEWPVGQSGQPTHTLAATLATLAARAGQASGMGVPQHEAAAPASDAGTTPMTVPPTGATTHASATAAREEPDDMSASSAEEIVDASSEQASGPDASEDSEDESRASGRGRTMADLPSESDFDNDSDGSEEYVQRKPRRRPSTTTGPTPSAPKTTKATKTPRQPSPQSGTKRRRSSSSVFNRVMKAWAASQITQLRPAPPGWEDLESMTELIEYAQTGSGQQRLVLPPDLSWARCFEARARRFGVTGLFHPFLRLSGAKKFITSKPAFEQLEYAKQWGDCLYILCRWKPVVGGKVQPLLLSEPPVLFQRRVIRAALQRDNVLHLWPSLFDPEPGVPPTSPVVLPGLAGELSEKLRQAEDAPPGSSSAR